MTYFAPKSEEEYKEYLDNLLIEYQFACFSEKLGDGCYRLANYHEAIKEDFITAAKIYKKSCDEMKYGHGCYRYGTFAFLGRGMEKNVNESTEYYERSCRYGYGKGCHNAAIACDNGEGCEKNIVKAIEYFTKGCNLNVVQSCLSLWSMYFRGRSDLPKNGQKAIEYTSKACDLLSFEGCSNAATMYRRGDLIEKNLTLAKQYQDKAIAVKKEAETPGVVFGEQHKNV
ncbi:unnamed protein product [Didymodactylos carnosus]|uniref:Uncharacterized protein n=1 Tax=Didymodactylos carnosus TaxID=1234261 RepID=A0A814J703_9BILA|nr:unnamed protein product [Didymodactylos carnosus]CAF1032014.1 unnamed protein product [Didymodactylos carnosus]CAF3540480.1 unnamed protein product [Didymodactylos carnosus]CAF3802794.1 unnamed protein product [Didymodactylos carnosus]